MPQIYYWDFMRVYPKKNLSYTQGFQFKVHDLPWYFVLLLLYVVSFDWNSTAVVLVDWL